MILMNLCAYVCLCVCMRVFGCVHVCVSQLCVSSMASLETIGPLMNGMKVRADMVGVGL